ncbi:hypothetical protein JCM11641_001600 [Rhodosporidiobolus odoratus]
MPVHIPKPLQDGGESEWGVSPGTKRYRSSSRLPRWTGCVYRPARLSPPHLRVYTTLVLLPRRNIGFRLLQNGAVAIHEILSQALLPHFRIGYKFNVPSHIRLAGSRTAIREALELLEAWSALGFVKEVKGYWLRDWAADPFVQLVPQAERHRRRFSQSELQPTPMHPLKRRVGAIAVSPLPSAPTSPRRRPLPSFPPRPHHIPAANNSRSGTKFDTSFRSRAAPGTSRRSPASLQLAPPAPAPPASYYSRPYSPSLPPDAFSHFVGPASCIPFIESTTGCSLKLEVTDGGRDVVLELRTEGNGGTKSLETALQDLERVVGRGWRAERPRGESA